jgi:acetyl-CoA carboxylase biotin carboxyl carrier protein
MGDQQNSRRTVSDKGARRQEKAASPGRSVNMDELRELIGLLRDNGLAEFELEQEGFRVRLRRDVDYSAPASPGHNSPAPAPPARNVTAAPPAAAAAVTVPVHPGAQAESAASEDQNLHIIPSPIVGTFYRSASPNAEPFVKIGSHVSPDSVVCIIEAMKLMNEIQAETSGEVIKIYVENGQPVEYGQPLFGVTR